jgi:ATP-dependent metalloprotease FtsH
METKHSRRGAIEQQWRQRKKPASIFSRYYKFLKAHKREALTVLLLLAIFALLVGIALRLPPVDLNAPPHEATEVNYTAFVDQIRAGNMKSVTIQGNELIGTLVHALPGQTCYDPTQIGTPYLPTQPEHSTVQVCNIYAQLPERGASALMSTAISHHVVVTIQSGSQFPTWLLFLAMGLLPVIILLLTGGFPPGNNAYSLDSVDKRISNVLNSRVSRFHRTAEKDQDRPQPEPSHANSAPPYTRQPAHSTVTFDDVAGIDEIKDELKEVVEYLRAPGRYTRLGAAVPLGILLAGPPGTGKTLLAKAVAGEAGVPFFSICASEFVEMFVGVGAKRVRDLFQQARQSAPCVVFIDEIDAVGRKRTLRLTGSDERDQTLNQLLVEMDGFQTRQTVIVLAATNRVDILDEALLRPGRFDRQLSLSLPDRRGREAILRVHTRHVPLHAGVHLEDLARMTTGMNGADLANLVNEAALYAARHDMACVTSECFEEALIRIQLGAQRALAMNSAERRSIAYHESGHALVAWYVPGADPVKRISILPRGRHLGITQFVPQDDRYNYNRSELIARIAVKLAGRIAVELALGADRVTTGAEDDLQAVTALARRMVTHWGMSSKIGVLFADYRELEGAGVARRPMLLAHQPNSTALATLIDAETQSIIQDGYKLAHSVLTSHFAELTEIAETLLTKEEMEREEIEEILRKGRLCKPKELIT